MHPIDFIRTAISRSVANPGALLSLCMVVVSLCSVNVMSFCMAASGGSPFSDACGALLVDERWGNKGPNANSSFLERS